MTAIPTITAQLGVLHHLLSLPIYSLLLNQE